MEAREDWLLQYSHYSAAFRKLLRESDRCNEIACTRGAQEETILVVQMAGHRDSLCVRHARQQEGEKLNYIRRVVVGFSHGLPVCVVDEMLTEQKIMGKPVDTDAFYL